MNYCASTERKNDEDKRFEFDAEILQNVIALRDPDTSFPSKEAEQLYDKFVAIVDKVAQITDHVG